MLATRKGKVIYAAAAIILTAVMSILQGTADAGVETARDVRTVDLCPPLEEDKGAGEDSPAISAAIANLLPQEVREVTAELDISDMTGESEKPENTAEKDFVLETLPTVLIYHTHTTEAYRQTEDCKYKASGDCRTHEEDKNITEVGRALASELRALGCTVFHDTTDHEPPKLSTSYDRSIHTIEENLEKHPEINMLIDVHRDASGAKNTEDIVLIDGVRCARLMFVVGKGTKYDDKPNFEKTYALANALTEQLEDIEGGFTRDIRVKSGRYNQHLLDMSLLVEVGHNANTLDEALASVKHLAHALCALKPSKD